MTYDTCGGAGRSERSYGRHRHRGRTHGRKERVLHTRISEELSDDIRRLAEDLRVPASNLVRNVLEEVFSVVERVSDDMGDLFGDVLEEAEEARERVRQRARGRSERRSERASRRASGEASEAEAAEPADSAESADAAEPTATDDVAAEPDERFADVFAWQPIVLNRGAVCLGCSAALERGERVLVGLGDAGPRLDVVLCRSCEPR